MEKKYSKRRRRSTKIIKEENLRELNKKNKIYLNQEYPTEEKQFLDKLFPPDENSLLGQDINGKYTLEIVSQKNKIFISEIEWKRSKKNISRTSSI